MPLETSMNGHHVPKAIAEQRIQNFRDKYSSSPKGILFTTEQMEGFVVIWKEILEVQPAPPAGFNHAVGVYFSLADDGSLSVIFAPVLANADPASTVDAIDAPADFVIEDTEPYFFYNEGQKWP
jgi:hypothetical protein